MEGIGDTVGDRPDGHRRPAGAGRWSPLCRRAASPVSTPAGKWAFFAVAAAGLTAVADVLAGG